MSIKSHFIRNILREEGKRTLSNQGRAIRRLVKFRTGRLERDRIAEVLNSPEQGGTLRITVPHYHRILDIKRDVKNKRGDRVTRKSRRIYNRFIMGAYNSIAFRTQNDFSQAVKQDIILQYKGVLKHG